MNVSRFTWYSKRRNTILVDPLQRHESARGRKAGERNPLQRNLDTRWPASMPTRQLLLRVDRSRTGHCGWREHSDYFCADRLALSSTLSCFRVAAHASILALASLRLISPAMTFSMTSSISSPDLLRRSKDSSRSSFIVTSFPRLPFVTP